MKSVRKKFLGWVQADIPKPSKDVRGVRSMEFLLLRRKGLCTTVSELPLPDWVGEVI